MPNGIAACGHLSQYGTNLSRWRVTFEVQACLAKIKSEASSPVLGGR